MVEHNETEFISILFTKINLTEKKKSIQGTLGTIMSGTGTSMTNYGFKRLYRKTDRKLMLTIPIWTKFFADQVFGKKKIENPVLKIKNLD